MASSTPLTMFPLFPHLPFEIRLSIWQFAIPDPRIVHIKLRRLKEQEGDEWWGRVRSEVPMWPCDKPFEQDELAPWEKDTWLAKFEFQYDGDDIFDDVTEIERLEEEIAADENACNQRWTLPDFMSGVEVTLSKAVMLKLRRRVNQGEWYEDVLREMEQEGKAVLCYPYEMIDDDGDSLDPLADSEEDEEDQEDQEDQDDGNDLTAQSLVSDKGRPMVLWGFDTECDIPAMLLVCKESHSVASQVYSLAFSSIGALPQIYLDFKRDTLYIDNESFPLIHEHLTYSISRWMAPEDRCQIKKLAIEGLHPCAYRLQGKTKGCYDDLEVSEWLRFWLISAICRFSNVREVIDVIEHYSHGSSSQGGKKYNQLKPFDQMKYRYGAKSFYVNNLRVDGSIIDWESYVSRTVYWADPETNHRFHLALGEKEWKDLIHSYERPRHNIHLKWSNLISREDEELLMYDVVEFEKDNNKGDWHSYWNDEKGVVAKYIPKDVSSWTDVSSNPNLKTTVCDKHLELSMSYEELRLNIMRARSFGLDEDETLMHKIDRCYYFGIYES